uniref:PPM-type phosphatase domain-containing protein n=1 Tax=Trypanosoma congolense (strain IL3000) TaxID=1068625 RepID=G0UQ48_TRYCI|nr:putative protein phosphatase 2C [Trypanosoma congolense IL3000]
MYTSVRKPPLSTAKLARKTDTKGETTGAVEEPTVRGTGTNNNMPSVSKRSNSCVDPSRGNDAQQRNSNRGGQLTYQTTNSLFTGSGVYNKLKDIGTGSDYNGDEGAGNSSKPALQVEGRDGVSSRPSRINSTPPRRYIGRGSANCNASDNVAAVLGCSALMGNDRVGSGDGAYTRRVFSGPPSTRVTTNQLGEEPNRRPQPPGSGRAKSGIRQLQFALNANSSQRLVPVPPRHLGPAIQARRAGGGTVTAMRCGSEPRPQRQDTVDPFDMTRVFNGIGSQLGLSPYDSLSEGGTGTAKARGSKSSASTTLPLASLRLQQLSTAPETTLPRGSSEVRRTSLSTGGAFGGATEESGDLGYDFRVVAGTGKTFNLPIKLTAGVGCVQGHRPTMEDEHFVRLHAATAAGQPVSLLGILDGHCGRRVAELAAKHVPDNFIAHPALGENNALAFVESIIQADRAIFHSLKKGGGGFGLSAAFGGSGGSTLIAAAVHGRMLYVACLGDARAVLYDGNTTIPMSEDHKPTNKKEHTRILQCGGFVQLGRVCGVLAVSRALGDYEFKFNGNRFISNRELMVSNVADVRQINLTDASKFLLLACDGLWDAVQNEEATQFVRDFLCYTPDVGSSPEATKRALNNCCQKLAEFAVSRGSTDNVSVMLLFFHNVADVVASFGRPSDAPTAGQVRASQVSPRIFSINRPPSLSGMRLDARLSSGADAGNGLSSSIGNGIDGPSSRGGGRGSLNHGPSWSYRSRSLW